MREQYGNRAGSGVPGSVSHHVIRVRIRNTYQLARARLTTTSEAFVTHVGTRCGIVLFVIFSTGVADWCSGATPAAFSQS